MYHLMYLFTVLLNQTVADPEGGAPERTPWTKILCILLEKSYLGAPVGLAPLLWGTLDPPLPKKQHVKHSSSYTF